MKNSKNINNKLGCFVNMSSPNFLYGSIKEAIANDANCFMIYTGSPQTIFRQPIQNLKLDDFNKELKKHGMINDDVIVHAPYIINLASCEVKKRTFAVNFLAQEVERVKMIGSKYLILHPGSNINKEEGCDFIGDVINKINTKNKSVIICLETMAGKGNEIGGNFKELKNIIDKVNNKDLIGVCLDTCHINDAGYNVSDVNKILQQFNHEIELNYLKVIHINDSLNSIGSHTDRHANIGNGTIGLVILKKWVNHPLLKPIYKILETPWSKGIYKKEINVLLKK